MQVEQRTRPRRLTWRRLLWGAAAANLAVLLVVAATSGDEEAFAFAGLFAVALLVLRLRGGLAGPIMVGVLAANGAAWMLPAAASNVINREQVLAVMIPASLAIISLTAATAAIVSIIHRRTPDADGRAVRIVAQTAIVVFVLAAAAAVIGQEERTPVAGEVPVEMRSASFAPAEFTASAGEITVAVSNADLFWHTFTIEELDVNVGVPTRGVRRITFGAGPGSYTYYCAVPGHRLIGMEGTLRVR